MLGAKNNKQNGYYVSAKSGPAQVAINLTLSYRE